MSIPLYLESERLYIIPVSPAQLAILAADVSGCASGLAARYPQNELNRLVLEIVKGEVGEMELGDDRYLFHTFWQLLKKSSQEPVGLACFKGQPDERGEIEIGYAITEFHQGHGYMTEAVTTMCGWALAHPQVTAVVAETAKENKRSHNVLRKCGFSIYYGTREALWWRICR